MHLSIVDDSLQIEFSLKEQLLAVRFHKVWQIPLTHITQVTTELPPNTWKEIRAPGSFVPGLIKAGTYYTDRGKEFWYVTRKNDFGSVLTIDLENESYQRIVLNDIESNQEWQQQLTIPKS
ncbi:hypothetical protein H6G54_17915 [Anabaena cylindrica FACHB-243]|uniref:Uncharacterized protein n=1 Tax=Anabaena cylindrica (strain ATCC 27899 / PCC 7122) TaxID=272123 RepID=K9ZQP6_ANACC|nr:MULTISPECIES: hypothetical protein [Anabaena]AFZ60675.1 hypothetical protein Anacy_5354 [Anabaena cylindrica PCC 7122]MBD2419543.1 hypothetical protein [Anabaena cylindrica FACHB-243]MBY5282759.1 hypothetical protein [Anabaena sp. CCAP 1446/1C]MBY5309096.1 hypothetical protein [Anabaena sp. CCAP 1446/1C]MCM2409737.1 hypothetical protein [Anabaena sp. CCAP 1446/1C]